MSFAKGTGDSVRYWEEYLTIVAATIGAFFLGIILGSKLMSGISEEELNSSSTMLLVINFLPYLLASIALIVSAKITLKRPFLSVITSRESFGWKRFFFAFGLWFLMQTVFLFMAIGSGAPIVFSFSLVDFLLLLLVAITLVPIQTAFEEVFFRGLLFQWFTKTTGRVGISIALVAILFGLIHAGNREIAIFGYGILAYYIISGLFLGLLAHFDDGLELGMGYHFANNFFLIFVVTNTWQSIQTKALFTDYSSPSYGWEMWLPLAVLQPALLYTFYRIYRWKNPLKRILE